MIFRLSTLSLNRVLITSHIDDWHAVDSNFPPKLSNVKKVVDHIDHIKKVAGIDHVGIGTDFDGGGGVEDCFDVSQLPTIP